MNWSRTKTVFILTFFLLNIYLGWQLYQVNDDNQLSSITSSTIQDKLRQNQIDIATPLPDDMQEAEYIVGQQQTFTEIDVASLSGQEFDFLNEDRTLLSTLDEPFSLEADTVNIDQFLSVYVLHGDEYEVVRSEEFTIYLDQVFEDKTVFTNHNEPLILSLNEQGEIIGYEQHYSLFEKQGNPKDTLANLRAIETLINRQYITMNETVVNFEIGYYSFFSESPVFAPILKVDVDKGDDEEISYLVNAFEGTVQEHGMVVEDEEITEPLLDNPPEMEGEDLGPEEDLREEE
ncbi:two-component system regulatory protein YycI [Alkalicoccobacillus porphyridii]|uniref:Regulatory protein YycH-like domain-containing protein n=1 Tax=Alkalicoccobacillus porphyridii TaxID=2597270 RepID=A0A554A1E2_9BACI|nr:two-component system regulatory protein YycI [Alkalicoccobacillus porphyridii]TSB47514.1 hypothetical protein FN960_07195 [Alkalicoccobacillus porphyridii]